MCSPVKILIFWLIHCVCEQRRNGLDTSGNRRLTDILFLKGMVMNGTSIIDWNVLILWLRVWIERWNTSCIMLMTPGDIAYEQTLIHAGIVYCNDNIEPQYDYSLSIRDVSRLFFLFDSLSLETPIELSMLGATYITITFNRNIYFVHGALCACVDS